MATGVDEGLLPDGRSWVGEASDAFKWLSAVGVYVDEVSEDTRIWVVLAYRAPNMEWLEDVPIGAPAIFGLTEVGLSRGRTGWIPALYGYSWSPCS